MWRRRNLVMPTGCVEELVGDARYGVIVLSRLCSLIFALLGVRFLFSFFVHFRRISCPCFVFLREFIPVWERTRHGTGGGAFRSDRHRNSGEGLFEKRQLHLVVIHSHFSPHFCLCDHCLSEIVCVCTGLLHVSMTEHDFL